MIERATWLKLNDAELDLIAPGPASPTSRAEALLHRNNLDLLVLTKGARGALALARSGEMAEITPQSQTQVVDTVGAGDAFSAVVLLGLMEAWDLQRTLVNAQHLASRVVGQQGATPSDRAFYEPIRRAWELS
jgi:fructokinase